MNMLLETFLILSTEVQIVVFACASWLKINYENYPCFMTQFLSTYGIYQVHEKISANCICIKSSYLLFKIRERKWKVVKN